MAGRREDPALDPAHQHTHGHLHHSPRASGEGISQERYTLGTTAEPSIIPNPSPQDHSRIDTVKKVEYNVTDVEKGNVSPITPTSSLEQSQEQSGKGARFYRKYRTWVHLALWMIATGWWTAGLGLHHADKNWVVPFLLWLAITIRLVTLHVSISPVSKAMRWTWKNTGSRVNSMIPEKLRLPLGGAITVAVILIGSFVSEETVDNTRENRAISLFGLAVLIFALWLTSRNRKAINWHTVISGMLMQYIIALFVLRTSVGYDIFNFISGLARSLLGFAKDGVVILYEPSSPSNANASQKRADDLDRESPPPRPLKHHHRPSPDRHYYFSRKLATRDEHERKRREAPLMDLSRLRNRASRQLLLTTEDSSTMPPDSTSFFSIMRTRVCVCLLVSEALSKLC
jgi:concentrative nucleoside transporter, CNT family